MFDAWQAQQKAQKDQERKAKTEATAALQGYRKSGLTSEETKLAAMREEERLKRLQAQEDLHGYQHKLTKEEEELAKQRQEELRKKQLAEEELRKRHTILTSPSKDDDKAEGVDVSALASGYNNASPTNAPSTPERTTTKEETTTTTTSTDPPSPMKLYKSSVKFMFGIVKANSESDINTDGYLARANAIAQKVLADNAETEDYKSISSSIAYPTMLSVKNDETNPSRVMATISISYFAIDKKASSEFKRKVVEQVRLAIDEGKFTKLELW